MTIGVPRHRRLTATAIVDYTTDGSVAAVWAIGAHACLHAMIGNMLRHTPAVARHQHPLRHVEIAQDIGIERAQGWCVGIADAQHVDRGITPQQRSLEPRVKLLVEQQADHHKSSRVA